MFVSVSQRDQGWWDQTQVPRFGGFKAKDPLLEASQGKVRTPARTEPSKAVSVSAA